MFNTKIYQIYYKESQKDKLDFIPYHNPECSVFFENEVIANLVLNENDCDYFGVVGPEYRNKIDISKRFSHPVISNMSRNHFEVKDFYDLLNKEKPDALSFQNHMPHNVIQTMAGLHPKAHIYFEKIMQEIGYKYVARHHTKVVYSNLFIMKLDLYKKYVNEMLLPAMEVMRNMPELTNNSNYPKQLPKDLSERWGINHYPYHTFICERMPTVWMNDNNINLLNY